MASKLTVHKVQPGEARVGCDPRGVQIFYKESTTLKGDPEQVYLTDLLTAQGFQVTEGDQVSNTPLRYLCVTKENGIVTTDEVLTLLAKDQAIDVSNVSRPEGNKGQS